MLLRAAAAAAITTNKTKPKAPLSVYEAHL